jgi:DNA-binding MarR family transcriptional regulator
MTLENDLNITRFRSNKHKASLNLIYTFQVVNDRFKDFFKPYDITSQQFNILRILRGAKAPLTVVQIRRRMIDKMSDTSRIVDRLLLRDLVTKVPNEKDRRLVEISLTTKGSELLAQLDVKIEELDNSVGNLTELEFEQLNNLLDKVRHAKFA